MTKDAFDDMNGCELMVLAMAAFLHMKKEKILTDEELLEDILGWMNIMTLDIKAIEAHQVQPAPRGVQ